MSDKMKEYQELLSMFRKLNIFIREGDNGRLDIEAPEDTLTDDIIAKINTHKGDLMEYLRNIKKQNPLFDNIPEVKGAGSYLLSSSQMSLWMASRIENESTTYNIPNIIELSGKFDPIQFEHAILFAIQRHEILRTVFRENAENEAVQYVLPVSGFNFKLCYLDLINEVDGRKHADNRIREDKRKAFDLSHGPLIRTFLFRLEEEKFIFYFNIHHIVSDGWSMEILRKEVLNNYTAYFNGLKPEDKPLRIQYKDYASWQVNQLNTQAYSDHQKYWVEKLSGPLPVLNLPFSKPRPSGFANDGRILTTIIGKQHIRPFRNLCASHKATLFMGLVSLLNTLLYRYTGEEDIIVGSPVAGRDHAELEDQIGFYINIIPLRVRISEKDNFLKLMDNIRKTILSAYEHQAYPFDRLIGQLKLKRDISRSPLFDVMIALQNQQDNIGSGRYETLQDGTITQIEGNEVKYDLNFNFVEADESLCMEVGFKTSLYDKENIISLIEHFRRILELVVSNPEVPIGELDYLSLPEREQLLTGFNTTDTEYGEEKTIIDLFRQQAARRGNEAAVIEEGRSYSYGELDERSDRLANYLVGQGLQRGALVPICMERSIDLVTGILGILKGGGVYAPVDPSYPEERISYMLEDSGAAILLTTGKYRELTGGKGPARVIVPEEWEGPVQECPGGGLRGNGLPGDVAYVIYTSGSTGNPKGVMIRHRSVVNLIEWHKKQYRVSDSSRSTMMAGVGFDACALEMWSALLSGIPLYIIKEELRFESAGLLDFYSENGITHAFVPPVLIPTLVSSRQPTGLALQYVLIGGDKLPAVDVSGISYKLVNQYGPTEATVMVTDYEVTKESLSPFPIGRPLSNCRICILDERRALVPVGIIGEIYIGGIQLAQGYWRREELTREKFVEDPFVKGERLYRTGDLGRWLRDGNIECVGRIDDQVKIRGYRIEPGEIEQHLLKLSGVKKVIVVAREQGEGQRQLVAYLESDEAYRVSDLRGYLSGRLPEYMIPGYFVQLERMPLTVNGKIDKKLLPDPAASGISSGTDYVGARNEIEKKLTELLAGVLNRKWEELGIDDNFFDLGASSLTLIRMTTLLNEQFSRQIKVVSLFQHPTIRMLVEKCFTGETPPTADSIKEEGDPGKELDEVLAHFDV